jgi:FAD:protein FMN transferase
MPHNPPLAAHYFEALGTSCSLFAVGLSRDRLLEGEFWVRRLGARLTRFSPESELSRLNAAAGRWVDISAETEELLRESLRAFELSGGLVNIAVLPSMLAIGYTRSFSEGHAAAKLGRARPLPPLPTVLTVRRGGARLEAGCGIDLGGVAKGWMADRLRERLGPNALANLGGDLSAGGPGPKGDGWPVGLGGVTVMLRDHGAATSSVRRRRWAALHHLINPRTGLPAETGLEEVSVVTHSGFEAEVVAKTALLAGPNVARAYCATHALAWWLSPARGSAVA